MAVDYSEGKCTLESLNMGANSLFYEASENDRVKISNNKEMFDFINKFIDIMYEEIKELLKERKVFRDGIDIIIEVDPVTGYKHLFFILENKKKSRIVSLSTYFWDYVVGYKRDLALELGSFSMGSVTLSDEKIMDHANFIKDSLLTEVKIDQSKISISDVKKIAKEVLENERRNYYLSESSANEIKKQIENCANLDDILQIFRQKHQYNIVLALKEAIIESDEYSAPIDRDYFFAGAPSSDDKLGEVLCVNYFAPHLEKVSFRNQSQHELFNRFFYDFKKINQGINNEEIFKILRERIRMWLNVENVEINLRSVHGTQTFEHISIQKGFFIYEGTSHLYNEKVLAKSLTLFLRASSGKIIMKLFRHQKMIEFIEKVLGTLLDESCGRNEMLMLIERVQKIHIYVKQNG